ncbi:MAG: pyridoxal phosphate-dependent aminotransferase [Thaumarchaeota archaeon]|nr:pyridoxal phosphate-dependent aminotransferase [Nitrososphaerota archaeon]
MKTKGAQARLSTKARDLPLSGIRVIYDKAQLIPDVIHLEIGEPDLPTPAHIAKAGQEAISNGLTRYTPSAGTPELREAIARKLRSENSLDYDSSEIVVTSGANVGLSLAMLALVDPGSEVLTPNPGWANYEPLMKLVQATPTYYSLREEDQFRPRIGEMTSLVTDRTRAILLNSPSNPTGGVLEKDDLEGISDLARKKDLLVIADEVYEKLVYDGAEHHSIAKFEGMKDRTVTINAFSKTYRMTGWRLGYAAGPKEVISAMVRLNSCMNTCSSSVSQAAGVAALNGPQDCVKEMVGEFASRRDMFVKGLNQIQGFRSMTPKGAFYAFANASSVDASSFDLCLRLLEKAKVATVPGVSFGSRGEGYLRFSYAAPRHQLKEALARIGSLGSI